MSVSIVMSQSYEVPPEGAVLAEVEADRVLIWPAGKGGPLLSVDRKDWRRIIQEVTFAFSREDKRLAGYAAQEGNGYE